ncbi:MAG: RsmD family RNA methyltransferase [Candidatus Saccharimonas sp.]
MKQPRFETLTLDKIVGGGQALGTLEDGRKMFVWGGLPGETVTARVTKKKSKMLEGVVTEIHTASDKRVAPLDPDSYLSTSPWQIMDFEAEQFYKAALIEEAFELHNIVLPDPIEVYTDNHTSHYRNKVEFSWYSDLVDGKETLDLAFFRRGGAGKIKVAACALLPEPMLQLAHEIRDLLHAKGIQARSLKTLLIRCDQKGQCVWQLYLKDKLGDIITETEATQLPALGGELIYSDPRSPASRITERLAAYGNIVLTDTILDVPFRYATEGFFQVNIPVYEQALRDMRVWVANESSADEKQSAARADLSARSEAVSNQEMVSLPNSSTQKRVIDLYSGVGSIGLTIGGDNVTLVEINEDAVREMRRNIAELGREDTATVVLAPSEKALDTITSDAIVILDPPRAGLHTDVIAKLLEAAPERIIYLSCNPVTQARDVELLAQTYGIRHHMGYNFFPRTPHIEHLIVLDKKPKDTAVVDPKN